MVTPPQSPTRLVFGPFEVIAGATELRKSGVRIRLSGQPFQLLRILLERSGHAVSREELRDKLWSDGTFVDFEHGLNAAINKLRRALGDSAENPRYIETVMGCGYRFIGSVQELTSQSGSEPTGPARNLVARPSNAVTAPQSKVATARVPKRIAWIVGAAALAAIGIAGGGLFYFHRTPALTEKDTLVFADFQNATGDPVFDETLRQGLVVQLQQSPFLSLVSEERIQRMLRLMGRPAHVRLTPELAREVCERTAGTAVLEGSIARLGSQYVLSLSAKNCSTGSVFDQEQAQAERKEDVLNALSQIASRFRTRIGESLATIEKHDVSLAEATTPSLEALKAYSAGWRVLASTGDAAALPFFKRSIEIDPKFAMAHAALGRIYGDIGEADASAENTSNAYRLRDRVSDAEKFWIAVAYDTQITENQEKAQETCELWAQTYPRDATPHHMLAGIIYPILGKHEQALEESRKGIGLDPDFAIGYSILAKRNLDLNRLDGAETALQRASVRNLEIPNFPLIRYDIAFLRGDPAEMGRQSAQAEKSQAQDEAYDKQSFVLAYFGHLQQARRMSQIAADLARRKGQRERAAVFEAGAAVREALFGNASAARHSAMATLELSKNRGVQYGAAFALALLGDSAQPQAVANDLGGRFPEDTSVQFSYLPALRARLALNRGESSKAIELLQAAVPYEQCKPRITIHGFFGALYPVYVRGEAYLAGRQGTEAAAEFQKILDHRGIVVADPIGALARLQLGRAFALAGNKSKAKTAYQDFLTLWKDADPAIPILKQAKVEYAKLK